MADLPPLWKFAAGRNRQRPERDLAGVSDLKASWLLGDSSTLGYSDPASAFPLEELVDDVLVWCDGDPVSRFRCGGTGDTGDEKLHVSTTYQLADYRELLKRRDVDAAATHLWANTDPATSLWTLISEEQARPGSDLGIVRGAVPTPAAPIASFNVATGDFIGDAGDKLSVLGDGFEWDILPTGPTGLRLDTWRHRGSNRGEVLEWSRGGAVAKWTRGIDPSKYGNAGRLTGQAPDGGTEPTPQIVAVSDLATRPEGRWSYSESTDQTSTSGLAAYGQKSLNDRQQVPASWQLTIRDGWWKGPKHLWLGDTALLVVKGGRLNVVKQYPVQQISCDFAAAGPAYPGMLTPRNVVIGLGTPRAKAFRSQAARISALEQLRST